MLKAAALIRDGVVVNVAVYDEDTSAGWLKAVKKHHDEVRVVDQAGIGWTVEDDGLRPPSPFPSWTWDGNAWVAPIEKPEGDHVWDEEAGAWKPLTD
jgi:hypothetical protein